MESLDLAKNLSQQSSDRSNWWKQKYMEFNPDKQVQQAPTFSAYDNSMGDIASKVGDVASKTGYTGDISSLVSPIQHQLGREKMGMQANSGNDAFFGNNTRFGQGALQGYQKGMNLMGQSDQMKRRLDLNNLQWKQTQDAIARMKAAQAAQMSGWDVMAGALGSTAGSFLGSLGGGGDVSSGHGTNFGVPV